METGAPISQLQCIPFLQNFYESVKIKRSRARTSEANVASP